MFFSQVEGGVITLLKNTFQELPTTYVTESLRYKVDCKRNFKVEKCMGTQ